MAAANSSRPFIFVLAGVNGAGKSSVGGALLTEYGLTWFNPDTYARELVAQTGLSIADANSLAWEHGRTGLAAAIANGSNYAFETTLGASTIPELLATAAHTHRVVMLFCGLTSVDMHIARVQARVAGGGHDIPENKIRERWIASRANLIKLLPRLTHLQVFDNSITVRSGEEIPAPTLVLEMVGGELVFPDLNDAEALAAIPLWAQPIVQAAIELQ
jgi:predicted ABC-type ATPase